jgi:hypothetical protein
MKEWYCFTMDHSLKGPFSSKREAVMHCPKMYINFMETPMKREGKGLYSNAGKWFVASLDGIFRHGFEYVLDREKDDY